MLTRMLLPSFVGTTLSVRTGFVPFINAKIRSITTVPSVKNAARLGRSRSRSYSNALEKPNFSQSGNSRDSSPQFTSYGLSSPDTNIVDFMRNYIAQELHGVSNVDASLIFSALEWTNGLDKGDLLLPVPRLRVQGANPRELATNWAERLPRDNLLSRVDAKGPFLHFYFNPQFLFRTLIPDILHRGKQYGSCNLGSGKTVIIEFSSPNIAKPFHAGHLRSTIIGGFLANLYETFGWKVIRMNYLGDWGKQFGLLAVGFAKYGDEGKLARDPIRHLFDVYVRVNKDIEEENLSDFKGSSNNESTNETARAYFKRREAGDPDALELWRRFRELSIEKYIDTYSRLNIKYDVYSGESQVTKETIQKVLDLLRKDGISHQSQGAEVIDLTQSNKKLGSVVVKKSDGTTLYITRDIGAAIDRYEKYHFDKMIYVVASQQNLHVAQLIEILQKMGFKWANNLEHVNFGMVQGMSTRRGTVVFLDTILEEARDKMLHVMKKNEAKYAQIENPDEVADLVGISAVMIQDMQAKRINNYEFKWERMLSFEGDTGPYLQYAHSRLKSLERNFTSMTPGGLTDIDYSLLREPQASHLIRILAQYPDILRSAMKTKEPATIVTYLFKLTHQVSSCYKTLWVSGQTGEVAAARLALYAAARQVLYNGMTLLGLTPVDRM